MTEAVVVAKLERTSEVVPSQWQGELIDGRPIYIRYREYDLSVRIGPQGGTASDAVATEPWFVDEDVSEYISPSAMTLEEVCRRTGLIVPEHVHRSIASLPEWTKVYF